MQPSNKTDWRCFSNIHSVDIYWKIICVLRYTKHHMIHYKLLMINMLLADEGNKASRYLLAIMLMICASLWQFLSMYQGKCIKKFQLLLETTFFPAVSLYLETTLSNKSNRNEKTKHFIWYISPKRLLSDVSFLVESIWYNILFKTTANTLHLLHVMYFRVYKTLDNLLYFRLTVQ